MSVAKITAYTVKCTVTHRKFFSVAMNYASAVFLNDLRAIYGFIWIPFWYPAAIKLKLMSSEFHTLEFTINGRANFSYRLVHFEFRLKKMYPSMLDIKTVHES